MASRWPLLLLLLIGDRALNLPALSHNGRDSSSAAEPDSSPGTIRPSMSESQEHITSAILPPSPCSKLTGSTKQTTPIQGTWEETLHNNVTTPAKGTTLSNPTMTSILKDQGKTSGTTTLSRMAPSAENPKQDQTTVQLTRTIKALSASTPTTNGMESLVSPDSDKAATIRVPVTLTTSVNDIEPLGSMTTTVSEKSALTTSTTLDKITNTNEPLSSSTSMVIHTASLNTTTLGTTVLGTTMSGTQEGETRAAPPPPATPTMSKPPNPHQNAATGTPSHQTQSASGVGTTPVTALSASNPTANGMQSPVSPDPEKAVTITTPTALNTPNSVIEPSGSIMTTVSEKSAVTTSSITSHKITNTNEPLSSSTSMVIHTASLNTTTLGTTVLGTTMSGTQKGETTAAPPPPATPTMSKPPNPHQNTATGTPSHQAQSASSVGTVTAQSPEGTTAHFTELVPSSSGTMKSSMTGASQASPKYSQTSSSGAGACALDEYVASTGICMCNDSYYTHSELSRMSVTLHCWPQKIEVALSSCFLETYHWIMKDSVFSQCSSVNRTEKGRRAQVFTLEKKEGTCGLLFSINDSHALYSLKVPLVQVLPGSDKTNSTMLHFSCAYPLVVNISQTILYQVDSFPTVHVPSTGDTVIILSIFTDPRHLTPLKNKTAPLGMPLYVVLEATSSDPDRFALVANEVFASTSISKTEAVEATHHFVKQSCPVSRRLLQGLPVNGASLQVTLAFNLFRFSNSDTLYLHARVTLCDKQPGRPCQPTCSQKNPPGRNSPWETQTRKGLERGGSWIVYGPLRISESKASSSRSSPGGWMGIFLLLVIGWMLG